MDVSPPRASPVAVALRRWGKTNTTIAWLKSLVKRLPMNEENQTPRKTCRVCRKQYNPPADDINLCFNCCIAATFGNRKLRRQLSAVYCKNKKVS